MGAPPLPRQRHPGARGRARAARHRPVLRALDERVHPRVERRERGLVGVGGGVVLGQVHDPARHRPGRQALEGRHGRVEVGVVAVDRVDVVAQPHAGIGDLDPRRGGLLGEPRGQRAGVGGRDPLLEAEEAGRLGLQAAVDPARDEPVVVVAGGDQQLAVGAERAARGRRTPARRSRRRRAAAPRAARARRRGSRRRSWRATASSSGARRSARRSRSASRVEPRWRSETTSVRIGSETRLRDRWPTPPDRSTGCSSPTSRACSRARSRR